MNLGEVKERKSRKTSKTHFTHVWWPLKKQVRLRLRFFDKIRARDQGYPSIYSLVRASHTLKPHSRSPFPEIRNICRASNYYEYLFLRVTSLTEKKSCFVGIVCYIFIRYIYLIKVISDRILPEEALYQPQMS